VPYCTNCGTEEAANQRFCPVCGAPSGGTFGVSPMPPLSSGGARVEAQVLVGISLEPPRQSRWSVFLRLLLCLPLFFVAVGVGFVAFFVTVAAWFCSLFSGRVSDGLQDFLTSALRLYANILAYEYLLVPRWPGVTFHQKPNDQVTVAVDHVRLRRWSVFFRFILSYPANLVNAVLSLGTYPLLALMWVWGLLAGREPRPLHQALALVLRYQMRLQAYLCLLTPTQPFRGLFGEGVDVPLITSSALPQGGISSSLPTGAGNAGAEVPVLPTRWLVERSSKVALVIAIVLGVLIYAGTTQVERPFIQRVETRVAHSLLNSSHSDAVAAVASFEAAVRACPTSEFQGCVERAATRAHDRLGGIASSAFIYALVPPSARGDERRYAAAQSALSEEVDDLQTLPAAQAQAEISDQLPPTLAQLNDAYNVLKRDLDTYL